MRGPIETLMNEHRLIEKVLDSLERFASETKHPAEADRLTLGRYVTFLQTLADRCHHGKEEDLLFEALAQHGLPRESGPVAVMLEEHEMGRDLVRRMAAVAAVEGVPSPEAWSEARQAATDFVFLLQKHIQKEDGILFPMAQRVLPPAVQEELARAFEDFEKTKMGEGVHERMHALAEALLQGVRS